MSKNINEYIRDDKDTGCGWAPSCLDCPFPECLEDNPEGRQLIWERKEKARQHQIAVMCQEGKSTKTIAAELGISLRTVQRVLADKVAVAC